MKIDLDIRELSDPDGTRYWRVVVVDREEQVHRAVEERQVDGRLIAMDPAKCRREEFLYCMAEVSRAIADRVLCESTLDNTAPAP